MTAAVAAAATVLSAAVLAVLVSPAYGHGSLIIPPARNNHRQKNPANATGNPHLTQGPCVGGACLWFNEGCFVGCANCSGTMPVGGNQHNHPNCSGFVPTGPTLPTEFRTFNKLNHSTSGDWTRFHPWRSPGHAPVNDACGIAGAYNVPTGGGGETPEGAKQGDRGTNLPPVPTPTTWFAGESAEVGFMIAANHGGGYHYSLCPTSQQLDQACFDNTPLAFADSKHVVRFLTNGSEFTIPATDVTVGTYPTGSPWRLNPVPACACDWGRGCKLDAPNGSLARAYWGCPTCHYDECGAHVPLQANATPPFPGAFGQQLWNKKSDDWALVDRVAVPSVAPGRYVLQWRWDTEQNPQIWTHCSDIVVASRR